MLVLVLRVRLGSGLAMASSSTATPVEVDVEQQIKLVERKIEGVEQEIKAVEDLLRTEQDAEEKRYLRKEKRQLQKEERQLREEKRQLREKERQLRENEKQEKLQQHEKELALLRNVRTYDSQDPIEAFKSIMDERRMNLLRQFKSKDLKLPTVFKEEFMVSPMALYDGETSLLLHGLGTMEVTEVSKLQDLISREQVVAVVGTTGCGKTRTIYELLCREYGLYFLAAHEGNFGPRDIVDVQNLSLTESDLPSDERALRTKYLVWTALLSRALLLECCIELGYSASEFLLLQLTGSYHFGREDLCTLVFGDLRTALGNVIQSQQQVDNLRLEISRVWNRLKRKVVGGPVVVVDEAQALFDMQEGVYQSTTCNGETRTAFSPVYFALWEPSIGLHPRMLVSATEFVLHRESESGSSANIAKPFRSVPSFYEFKRWQTQDQMIGYVTSFIRLDGMQVDMETLGLFAGRPRPLSVVVQEFLKQDGDESFDRALLTVRQMLTRMPVRGSYNKTLLRIQRQPRINDVDLIALCRMISLKSTYMFRRYFCIREEEVRLIHFGLAYLDQVNDEELVGEVNEPLVLEALDYYFAADQSFLHMMNVMNASQGGFSFELAAARDLGRFLTEGRLSDHPLMACLGEEIPEAFRQRCRLFGNGVRLVSTMLGITDYLREDEPMSTMLNCEFMAGPDLAIPMELEDGRRSIVLVQFRLVEFLDSVKFESGVATTDPERILYHSSKKKQRFQRLIGNKWWQHGCIRMMVVYPAVFKNRPMPVATIRPASNGVGPQVKLYVHAGNAHQLFSPEVCNFADRFKGFQIGEPFKVAQEVQDKEVALKMQQAWNAELLQERRHKRQRLPSGHYKELDADFIDD